MTSTSRLRRMTGLLAFAALTAGTASASAAAVGGAWTLERPVIGQQPSGDLGGVSCVSGARTRCVAVGSAYSHLGELTSTTQLWNGSSWHDLGSPHRKPLTYLRDVSCTSARACMAVGDDSGVAGNDRTLAAQWAQGAGWRILPTPNPATAQGDLDLLKAVACPSATDCVAVGEYEDGSGSTALVETWDGSRWTVASVPPVAAADLEGVSCTSVTACVAVGAANGHPLVLSWDGTGWAVVPVPAPPGSGASSLHAVSCSAAQSCMAVGDFKTASLVVDTLAERWDGTSWSITDTQDVPGVTKTQLFDVSCVAADDCVAVGAATPPGGMNTVVEAWDGTGWQLAQSPNGKSTHTQFEAVSCVSATDCLAVGTATGYFDPPGRSFSARWNGSQWTAVSGGSRTGAVAGFFTGLSCASADKCVAVGSQYTVAGHNSTLAEVRTAGGWRLTPAPHGCGRSRHAARRRLVRGRERMHGGGSHEQPEFRRRPKREFVRGVVERDVLGATDPISAQEPDSFLGVSCVTRRWCVAVGLTYDETPLVETWDGTTWTVVDIAPPNGAYDTELTGISCVSAPSCVAVGGYLAGDPDDPQNRAFAVVEAGGSWRTVDTGLTGHLSGVSCTSATFCAAVGSGDQSSGSDSTGQIWNGSSWSTTPMPGDVVKAVSCITPTSCVAVGTELPAGSPRTRRGVERHALADRLRRGVERAVAP